MKLTKILALILAAILCFSMFTACSGNESDDDKDDEKQEEKEDASKDDKDEEDDDDDDDSEKKPSSNSDLKGYEQAVADYFDYFAKKKTDVKSFVTDAYAGGGFGMILNGKGAYEANLVYLQDMLGFDEELPDMYYYDIPSDGGDIDFEEFLKIAFIDDFYSNMEEFGDWELKYDIKKSVKAEEHDDFAGWDGFNNYFEEILEGYEDLADSLPLGSDEEEIMENFVDEYSNIDINEGYVVEVKVELSSSDEDYDRYSDTYEYCVANVDGEWIIIDGVSIYDICEEADG